MKTQQKYNRMKQNEDIKKQRIINKNKRKHTE